MTSTTPICPKCGSNHVVKNGKIHHQKPKYMCKDCGRQFVENPTNRSIKPEIKELIDKLLLERISLAGIPRVTGVSQQWLQNYVNDKYAQVEGQIKVSEKPRRRLNVECDELWSFVDNKNNQQWVWLAIDRDTKEIVDAYIGERSEEAARELWKSLPPVYRQCAVCYSDFWSAYACVLPSKRHKPVGKESGQTNHIERLNNTFPQRISPLVRQSLSFSKKLENLMEAIWYFIHHYNYCIAV